MSLPTYFRQFLLVDLMCNVDLDVEGPRDLSSAFGPAHGRTEIWPEVAFPSLFFDAVKQDLPGGLAVFTQDHELWQPQRLPLLQNAFGQPVQCSFPGRGAVRVTAMREMVDVDRPLLDDQ